MNQPHEIYLNDLIEEVCELYLYSVAYGNNLVCDHEKLELRSHVINLQYKLLSSKLISSAVKMRILDDQHQDLLVDDPECHNVKIKYSKHPSLYCGVLTINETSSQLSLREACNKVIHAMHVEFLDNYDLKSDICVHLRGEYWGNKWSVDLDIKKYCESISDYLLKLDEHWLDHIS